MNKIEAIVPVQNAGHTLSILALRNQLLHAASLADPPLERVERPFSKKSQLAYFD